MKQEEGKKLIEELISLPQETETVEFKQNNSDPDRIGECISALANSANLEEARCAYLVFGIQDKEHRIIGTKVQPKEQKVGNTNLEIYLQQNLNPKSDFHIDEIEYDNCKVVIFSIPPAITKPVTFRGEGYIRIGNSTTKLKDHEEKERRIWVNTDRRNFERGVAKKNLSPGEILKLLEYDVFFTLTKETMPSQTDSFVEKMKQYGLVEKTSHGKYDVLNIGALLFAKNLGDFQSVKRKSVRVIVYSGNTRDKREREEEYTSGYASSFGEILRFIYEKLPVNEEITKVLREEKKMYPDIAIREFVANALIHQDLSVTGMGPMIEIFDTRIEITNPGQPLIEPDRFIDHPPRARNEDIAKLMRQAGICEEAGTGIDRALIKIGLYQLPAPKFEVVYGSQHGATRVILYAHRDLKSMTEEERVRACFQHCVLQFIDDKRMTNATLRERLGIADNSYTTATKIIKKTEQKNLIKKAESTRSYVPSWV